MEFQFHQKIGQLIELKLLKELMKKLQRKVMLIQQHLLSKMLLHMLKIILFLVGIDGYPLTTCKDTMLHSE
jgi:hypothetical protein